MEETVSDLKESELNVTGIANGFEDLRARCKALGDHFISTRNSIQTRLRELQTREEEIGLREKQLEEKESDLKSLVESKEEELDAIEEVITEKLLEVEQGKTHLQSIKLLIEEKSRELDRKEERFLEVEKLLREKERDCDLIQKRIELGTEKLTRMEKSIVEMDLKVKAFSLHEKSMEDWCCKLELKERQLEGFFEKLALKDELFEPNVEELNVIANRAQECLNEAQRKEMELEQQAKGLELKERQVESSVKELKLIDMRVNECLNKDELKTKHFKLMEKSIQENKQRLDSLLKSVEEREKHLDSVSDELNRKERELEQQAKELELKRIQFDSQPKIEQSEHTPGVNSAAVPSSVTNSSSLVEMEEPESSLARNAATFPSSNLQLIATSDERNVPGFLNENLSGNNFIQNELCASLQLVPDPAKVVFNIMQKSLARYWINGDFEGSIMSSNISILKELLSVTQHVGSHLKEDATYLAAQWKTKMSGNTENSVESLAFLLFITTYGLVFMLNGDEIVKLLGLTSQNKRVLELCQTHAFAAKISDLIRDLIERKQLPEAVRFICTFKLIDTFPLVPLLEKYVEAAMKWFEAIFRLSITPAEKVKVISNQIADARALIQCIRDYNLDSEHPSRAIEIQIVQLETIEDNWRLLVPSFGSNNVVQQEQRKRKKLNTSTFYNDSGPR